MFSFTEKQKEYQIKNITIGGQPGRNPTVLFGGFFFKGEPELEKAKKNLDKMNKIGEKTGNPAVPDFFIKKEEYLEKILDFVENNLPRNNVFSIDIIEPGLKIKTLEKLRDRKLLDRTIYNSIHIGTTQEEIDCLKENTPEMAIIVAFNPKDKSPDGKIEVLENGANLTETGLLELSNKIGIKNILVDTAAMAPGDYSGASIAAIPVIKEEYGFPTGCAIHNVVEKSSWLKEFKDAKKTVDAASNINIPMFGGDFAIFGPVEHSEMVFPIIAWQDILISEYAEGYFGIKPADFHPIRRFY
jgi:tetrahydromethanopterin S-methyltransferase subunit H